jgi:hypothetical protein
MNPRLLTAFTVLFISSTIQAQVQFAFFAGPQTTSARYMVNRIKQPATFKYGYMGGVASKVEFDNQLYFFPSVYYSLKGYKVTLNNPAFPPAEHAKNNNTTIQTIEVGTLFQYDFNKTAAHFFVRFGPAVDYAFKGREQFDSINGSGTKESIDRAMLFSFGDYGRFSAQADLHFGYETGRGLMLFAFN